MWKRSVSTLMDDFEDFSGGSNHRCDGHSKITKSRSRA